MSVIKQSVAALILLGVAGVAWLKLDPAAPETLARYGLDHPALTALASTQKTERAEEAGLQGGFGRDAVREVVVVPTGTATVNDRLRAIGNGRALHSVRVTPYASGTIVEVVVDSGDRLRAGDVIALLDSREQSIAVESAKLALEDATTTLRRREALRSASAAAISNVEVADAELAVQAARLELDQAQLALERRRIEAPIDGVVGIVQIGVGDNVTADTEIVTIDDRSELLVDYWVSERFAGTIKVGQPVTATPIANPQRRFEGEVRAVDNRVDPESRTLMVRASLPNGGDRLRAGMSFAVTMDFPGESYPTVDPLAVQWSADGAYVWRVVDGTARKMPIRIVQRNSDSVLVDASIEEGDPIITEGLMQLRDGSKVAVVDGGPTGAAPVAAGEGARDAALNATGPAARRGS